MFEYLIYFLSLSTLFLTPLLAGVFVVIIIFFSTRHVLFGFGLALASVLLEAFLVINPAIGLGVNIFYSDLTPILLFGVSIIRLKWILLRVKSSPSFIGLLAFFSVLTLSLVIGFGRHGQAAGSDFRHFFYVLAAMLYMASFPREQILIDGIEKLWIFAAGSMCLLAIVRWAADAAGIQFGASWHGNAAGGGLRVLNAANALLISSGLVILLCRTARLGFSALAWVGIVLMSCCIILLQHRSVWVATLVGILIAYWFSYSVERSRLRTISIYMLLLVVILSPLILYGAMGSILEALRHSILEVYSRKSTISGRLEGWSVLLSDWRSYSIIENIIGRPFGAGYERYLAEYGLIKDTPHNYYIQVLLRGGAAGGFLLLMFIVSIIRQGYSLYAEKGTRHLGTVALSIIGLNLVYWLVYQAQFEQALLLGVCIGWGALPNATVGPAHPTRRPHAGSTRLRIGQS